LIVEDNEINLRMILKVLEYSKMSIRTARNGQEAIELLSRLDRSELDLILMDINMPIMDGYKATTLIRQDSKWQDLPIVALSALDLEQEIARMSEAGMDAFLPKPLNLKQLYTVFKLYLKDVCSDKKFDKDIAHTTEYKFRGLNIKDAMANIGDDIDILKDIMIQFRNDYRYSDKRLEFYIKTDDNKTLQKTLVDLIGLAGSIGAVTLFDISKEMYRDLVFSRFKDIVFKLPEFSKQLEVVCDSIDKFLADVS
jgi:CheY-like chemotaxis protein